MEQDDISKRWRRTAWSRLKFELSGLGFALKKGATPEEYADYLWSAGAVKWMGKENPSLQEYLDKETEAITTLYPQVTYTIGKITDNEAELTFPKGCCLGGWGRDQWGVAGSLGLDKEDVCRYCRQSFRSWSKQLGLDALPEPQADGACIFRVEIAG